LFDVELKLLAFLLAVDVGFFGGSQRRSGSAQLEVGFPNTLWKTLEIGTQRGYVVVDGLEVQQAGYGGMHED
jgi:hypothetical protein